jgi:uncharacterized Ntn-hydrolase superfamily protein
MVPRAVTATYSIVATDKSTGRIGGAGASCVGPNKVSIIQGVAQGVGVVHAQALVNLNGRDEVVKLLSQGQTPAQALAAVTAPSFDPQAAHRQYGVVDIKGQSATFTGMSTVGWTGDLKGATGPFTYAIQGNMLTDKAVLSQAEAAFVAGGCDLEDRLMRALEAGAKHGQGDKRCLPNEIPADAAFLRVEEPSGNIRIFIEVTNTSPKNPLLGLRDQFDAWRLNNPCPSLSDSGPPNDTSPTADAKTVSDADPLSGDVPSATADIGDGLDAGGEDDGCGCRFGAASLRLPSLLLLMVILAFSFLRRCTTD